MTITSTTGYAVDFYRSPAYASYEREYGAFKDWLNTSYMPKDLRPWGGELEGIAEGTDEMAEKLANNFLIGCDPEFVALDDKGRIISVEALMPHEGEVGYDHGATVIEVRPKPAMGTYALLKRIQGMLTTNPTLAKVNKYKWRAGAVVEADVVGARQAHRTLTLGGHVHIDLPPAGHGGDIEGHAQRVKALDRATKYLEDLDILPKAESQKRRSLGTREGYGKWGDVRPATNNERVYRTEYRTMASWLYDPKVAFICLTAAKLAAVSPQVALDTLKARSVSYENLKTFFEFFKARDVNARRACEKLLCNDIKSLQVDPDTNFQASWKRLGI